MNHSCLIRSDQKNYKKYIESICYHGFSNLAQKKLNPIFKNTYMILTGKKSSDKEIAQFLQDHTIHIDYCFFYADSNIDMNLLSKIDNNLIDICNENIVYFIETLQPKKIWIYSKDCKKLYEFLKKESIIEEQKCCYYHVNKRRKTKIYQGLYKGKGSSKQLNIPYMFMEYSLSQTAGWTHNNLIYIASQFVK